MSPCSPLDVNIDPPDGPSGPVIPGFGTPYSLDLPNINPFDPSFPEDLLDLFNKLQMLIPPGILKPSLFPNFSKDIFDAILQLMDQFLPFLMLYKFFLPLLKLLLCIIEVLCSLKNPFKLMKAIKRLFRRCIPDFLNLFPIFAIIMMIISLLLLLLALIEYLIQQILKLIQLILRNILNLQKAFQRKDDNSILAIARKIGSLLCMFQNMFVLLALFNIIFQIFRDILNLTFAIPPCEDTASSDVNGCCTPDVCPDIVKPRADGYSIHRITGILKYLPKVQIPLPAPASSFTTDVRAETWQLYDEQQGVEERFRNIFDAFDVITTPKPVFFPTDVVYNATTPVQQAAYTLDLRFYYNPANWSRPGYAKWVQFKDCILIAVPKDQLALYNNTTSSLYNGVVKLEGGLGYEDDGSTILTGFDTDGVTPISTQATLNNFLHNANDIIFDSDLPMDGYVITDVEYNFKPNIETLFSKDIITAGCMPDIAMDRAFVNNVLIGDTNVAVASAKEIMKEENGFPSPAAAQECLSVALAGLRGNLTPAGVAQFQATALACLNKMKADTENAIGSLIGLGFDPCNSNFTIEPAIQFTTRPIIVTANINEKNATPITTNLSPILASGIASRLKSYIGPNKGKITNFVYDGYQAFTASLTSKVPVTGQISVSFDDQMFCTNTMTEDDAAPTHTIQALTYQFVYTSAGLSSATAEADGTGQPRRDENDLARDK